MSPKNWQAPEWPENMEWMRQYDDYNSLDKNGIILSFDADSVCDSNYFESIENHFKTHPDTDGCSIYFEHPLSGEEFPDEVYKAIVYYELHMRYYYQGLKYTGHPNTFHTIGSSFAVKSLSYCHQGGMNTKQAGEDFYFLQKFFDLGNFTECMTTRIIPSPRPSDRVPFGTGPSVLKFIRTQKEILSYNPRLFEILREFIQLVPDFYQPNEETVGRVVKNLDHSLTGFLENQSFPEVLAEINQNSGSLEGFIKRFFRWFNMFRMLKYLNFASPIFPEIEVSKAAGIFYKTLSGDSAANNPADLLTMYRILERAPVL